MDAHLLQIAGPSQGPQEWRAAVSTFDYIAKSLGPQDVLSVLLTNLCVQEQSRICSMTAIAIVAETCVRE